MAQITGGKIFYSQTRQAAQFEPKKAEVELSFIVGEGEAFADIAKMAEDFAVAKVQEMIGAKATPAARQVQSAPPKPAVDAAPKSSPAMDTTPVDPKAAYAAAQAAEKATAKPAAKTSVPKAGKKADETKAAISTGDERVNPEDDGIDMGTSDDDILGAAEPVVVAAAITDAELTSAISKVNQKLNNAQLIRGLVATFVDPPKGSRDIPQEQRADFIVKLEALIAPKK